jgi:hypothetical protein
MWTWLKTKVLNDLIGGAITHFITKENWQTFADAVLDMFENLAAKSDNDIDDKFVAGVRKALNIPDDDD